MARITERNKIWIRPLATSQVTSKRLDVEDAYVCLDDEDRKDADTMSIAHCITENLQDKLSIVAEQLVEGDMKLREEYKQLLVQFVAGRLKLMPEEEIWKEIEKETGFNHRIVWNVLRETTIKKIRSLLPADDLVENISKEMRLSLNDWLLFDLILVHEHINVLDFDPLIMPSDPTSRCQGNARNNMEEPRCLQELFELVKQYDIENLVGEALAESWTRLTLQYNSRGRQCSTMMLQLRWYQMKEMTRFRFYNSLGYNKNHDIQKTLQSELVHELTALQNTIAVTYNTIITEEYPTWETLIERERVILPGSFTLIDLVNHENKTDSSQAPRPSNEPPTLLIKLDNQIRKPEGNNIVTEEAILYDLKNDGIDIEALEENGEQFEIRLIREVAKSTGLQEKHMWQKLSMELGRECKVMWNRMRNATAKKVTKLLAVNDVINKDGSPSMQLSATEWLLFDLVLVYENINLLNYDKLNSKCLRVLFELVHEYDVENRMGEDLVEAWINLTLKYNTGGRQCSPMLLQLRWYQLKKMARRLIYKPSMISNRNKTQILIAIGTKYQKIITRKWLEWNTLLQNKSVILPAEFIRIIEQKKKWIVLEPREVWYLHVKDQIGCYDTEADIKDTVENVICIVSDVREIDNVDKFHEILEQTPKDPNQLTISKLNGTKEPEIIELDSDDDINEILREKADNFQNISQEKVKNILNKPKIMSRSDAINKNTINKESINCDSADKTVLKPVAKMSINNYESICDSDDEMDKFLQEKANLKSIKLHKNPETLENLMGNEIDEFLTAHRMEVEESGIINREPVMANKKYEALDEVHIDENNIEFEDNGIKIEEACKYNTTKDKLETVSLSCSDDDSNADESEDKIDFKLQMNTSVYTKRIDCMEVFKFIDYNFVNDKRVIEYVQLESKPGKPTPKARDIESFREQAIPRYEKYSNQCDENKALAKKPLNAIMCSKRSDLKSAEADEMKNTDKNTDHAAKMTAPSIPDILTEDQNMEVTMTADDHNESDLMSNVISNLAAKRSKVINLSDKEEMRQINQCLLTAEIAPRHQYTLSLPAVNTKNSSKREPVRTIGPSEISSCKRFKTASETSQLQSPNTFHYCCWAREKIVHINKNLHSECSQHTCPDNHCTCCCCLDLRRFTSKTSLQRTNMPSLQHPNLLKVAVTKSVGVNINPSVNANPSVKTKLNYDKTVGFSKLLEMLVPKNTQNNTHVTNGFVNTRITNTGVAANKFEIEESSKSAKIPKISIKQNIEVLNTGTSHLKKDHYRETKTSTSLIKIAPRLPVNRPQTISSNCVVVPSGVNFIKLDNSLALAINPGVKLQPAELHSLMSVCALANNTQ